MVLYHPVIAEQLEMHVPKIWQVIVWVMDSVMPEMEMVNLHNTGDISSGEWHKEHVALVYFLQGKERTHIAGRGISALLQEEPCLSETVIRRSFGI